MLHFETLSMMCDIYTLEKIDEKFKDYALWFCMFIYLSGFISF